MTVKINTKKKPAAKTVAKKAPTKIVAKKTAIKPAAKTVAKKAPAKTTKTTKKGR
jgi:hypothetical protein